MKAAPASRLRAAPGRATRAMFLWASHRRRLGRMAMASGLTRKLVRRFVAGEALGDALDTLARLHARGFQTTVDVLGEEVSAAEASRAAADRYVELLDALATRDLDRNVSLKLSQLGLGIDEGLCRDNLRRIVVHAADRSAFVRVDMEDHTRTEATVGIVRELHATHPNVGVVIQSYLRRSAADVERLCADGIRVRLCKGAYDEPSSVAFPSKEEVDGNFRSLATTLLLHGEHPAFATHDETLIEFIRGVAMRERIEPERFEFQMLFGVRRDLQDRLRQQGYCVRLYVPFGREWYPYFMRRLAERPANILFMTRAVLREGRRPPRQRA